MICHTNLLVKVKVAECLLLTVYFRMRSETMRENQGAVIQEQASEYPAFMPGVRTYSGS